MKRLWLSLFALPLAGVLAVAGCSREEPPPVVTVKEKAPQEAGAPAGAEKTTEPEAARGGTEGGRKERTGLIDAPTQYLHSVTVDAPRHAQKKINTAFLTNEIRQYKALKGEYPPSLEKLEEWRGEPLPELPPGRSYKYDSSTGKLEVVTDE